MPKTNSSEVFTNWYEQVTEILNQLPKTTIDGQPLEYSDDEFQNITRKLQQCSLKFEDLPIYIINEKVATELCYDQLKGYEDNERSNI
tara:strand:+ start:345 stop:608 length:264 start_codon:yes stop_codon:yes gene_type:complete